MFSLNYKDVHIQQETYYNSCGSLCDAMFGGSLGIRSAPLDNRGEEVHDTHKTHLPQRAKVRAKQHPKCLFDSGEQHFWKVLSGHD